MKCDNHTRKEADGMCTVCGSSFCSECMIKVKRRNICLDCASEKLSSENKSDTKQNLPVFQQQQQQGAPKPTTPPAKSNTRPFDVIKWIIAVLLFASVVGTLGRAPLAGLIYLALGFYWIPQVMIRIQTMVFEKTGTSLSRMVRVGGSIFLYVIANLLSLGGV